MTTFKKIVSCIENGGLVQEFTTQMEVVAYIDTMSCKAIYLGHDRSISLEIPASELDQRGLEFIYIEDGRMVMEIKFWDRVNEEYRGDKDYLLNEYMGVYTEEFGYTAYLKKHDFIEPHFYINGVRVA